MVGIFTEVGNQTNLKMLNVVLHLIFLDSKRSGLDLDVLVNLGLNKDFIAGTDGIPDVLFFFRLLLPLRDSS